MIKIITVSMLIAISLVARLNPFEEIPLVPDEDDGKRIIKLKTQPINPETSPLVNNKKVLPLLKEKIIVKKPSKEELDVQKSINEAMKLSNIKTDDKVKEKIQSNSKKTIEKKLPIAEKKVKTIAPQYGTFKILPFLTIQSDKSQLKITSRKHYYVVTSHNLKKEKKIAFDFLAKVKLYSRNKQLNTTSFKSYAVGNHSESNFFRVTVQLEYPINQYKISIDNNIAVIKKK